MNQARIGIKKLMISKFNMFCVTIENLAFKRVVIPQT